MRKTSARDARRIRGIPLKIREKLPPKEEKKPARAKKKQTEPAAEEIPEPVEAETPAEAQPRFSERVLKSGDAVQSDPLKHKELMKKFRRAKSIPSDTDVERFESTPEKGLTSEQVELRFSQFLFNDVNKKYSKSYRSILVGNICTFFNLLCLIVAIAFVFAGATLSQYLFVLIFGANLLIGIVQEILAKKQTDKLSLLISATAKVVREGVRTEIPVQEIVLDDIVMLEAGQQIPADCILLEGVAEVNESLLTGESVPIKKNAGDMLYAGSYVASGACRVRADKVGKATYINTLTAKAKKYKKPKSEIMNSIRLFIRVIGVLIPFIAAAMCWANWDPVNYKGTILYTGSVVIGMIPSGLLLLTTLAMALGVIRLAKKQTLVQDLYSLEMLARVNVLCLDKTGTITDGRMTVNDCMILNNFVDYTLEDVMGSMLSSLEDNNQTSIALYNRFGHSHALNATQTLPFSSKRKLSAVTFGEVGTFVMGAPEFVLRPMPPKIDKIVKQYAQAGLRVLVLAYSPNAIVNGRVPPVLRPAAIITLADNIRADAIETIAWFRENDVDIRIISGDNPVTVSEVARRVGVKNAEHYISLDGLTDPEVESVASQYTVFGRVTPEQKAILVKALKKQGNTVAMTGDGVNDILALKEADCAVSVASGSEAARNVSHLVLMDNNFLNLPSVVHEGRRVINNIKSSAALYIMKTLFVTILSVICLCMGSQYFFQTNNMLLFEMLVAALPSAVISFQPNTDRVRGKFIPYVMSRSIPSAITLLICVMATYLGIRYMPGQALGVLQGADGAMNALLTLAITFGGMVMLYRFMQPFNWLRAFTYAFSLIACIVVFAVPQLGNLAYTDWANVELSLTQILYLMCVLLASFPISATLIRICDLMNPSETSRPKK